MAFITLGVIILWFGWFGFNPGSTLSVDFGGIGFFAYVALNTNLAAAAGVIGAVLTSWIVIRKPDLSMMLNGAIAALVAITAACAFVAPWAAIVIGFLAGVIVVLGVLLVERIGIDDPIGAIAAHGMAGVWGTLALGFLTVPCRPRTSRPAARASSTGAGSTSSASRLSASGRRGVHVHRSFACLWPMKVTAGIRAEPEARPPVSTSPSTACGATPSSTSRFRAATARKRTGISAPAHAGRAQWGSHRARGGRRSGAVAVAPGWRPAVSHGGRASPARARTYAVSLARSGRQPRLETPPRFANRAPSR